MTRAEKILSLTVIAAISAFGIPATADAAVQCKSNPSATLALTQASAIDAWRTQVTNVYGTAWSNFDLAQNKQFSETNLGVAVMHQVSARPCRQAVVLQVVPLGTMKAVRP